MIDYKTGDYIAFNNSDLVAVWREGEQITIYTPSGTPIDRIVDTGISGTTEARTIAMLYADMYALHNPQMEIAL